MVFGIDLRNMELIFEVRYFVLEVVQIIWNSWKLPEFQGKNILSGELCGVQLNAFETY